MWPAVVALARKGQAQETPEANSRTDSVMSRATPPASSDDDLSTFIEWSAPGTAVTRMS